MKQYFHAYAMCQSMFCAIPFPCKVWDEDARPHMLLFLPCVGFVIGLFWWFISLVCTYVHLPHPLSSLLLCAYPFAATGYIHLDGFMDVTDAVKSCRSLDRRREILKDSHVGSFSVISCILLILSQFACFLTMDSLSGCWRLLIIPIISRCCSSLAVSLLPSMSTSQFSKQVYAKIDIAVPLFLISVLFIVSLCIAPALCLVLMIETAAYCLCLIYGYRSLEGMNGDIAGYCLTCSELCAIFSMVIL